MAEKAILMLLVSYPYFPVGIEEKYPLPPPKSIAVRVHTNEHTLIQRQTCAQIRATSSVLRTPKRKKSRAPEWKEVTLSR